MIKFGIQMELTIPILTIPTTLILLTLSIMITNMGSWLKKTLIQGIIEVQMNIVVTYIPSTSMPVMKLDNSKDVFTFPWLLPSRYSCCLR